MRSEYRDRLDAWLPAILLFTGSAVFLGAGRLHPLINDSLGAIGTTRFYHSFASEMLHTPHWQAMHLGILLGPIFWALGVAGMVPGLPMESRALGTVASTALLIGASFWGVAFVLDGYVGPGLAEPIVAQGEVSDQVAIRAFRANQLTMARLGMLSVVLVGAAMSALGVALLFGWSLRSWRAFVGILGVMAGAWPIFAALTGRFYPGPFTDRYWTATALSLGVWFLLLGTVLPRLVRQRGTSP